MNNVEKFNQIRSFSTNHFKSSVFKNSDNNDNDDISYNVDSPPIQSKTLTNPSSFGYLNAFLLKKQQQQSIHSQNIDQFEKPDIKTLTSRPKSVPLIDQSLSITSKPTKNILQQSIHDTIIPISNKSSPLRSKSVTFGWENYNNDTSSTDDEKINNSIDQTRNSRINIGITLDSRLRKTPVLDMLRSTTMQSDIIEPQQLNRTYSLRHSSIPIARF